jgi:hypothetical protein
MQNNYRQLFDLIVEGFIQNGFEIVNRDSWIVTLRRWKLSHEFIDLKVVESEVNVFFDDIDEPSQIVTRFAYYDKGAI